MSVSLAQASMPLAAPERITLLYDAQCRICVPFAEWIRRQPLRVALDLVPCGSPTALARFPELDHAATRSRVTVVDDRGYVWAGDAAWIMVLWATAQHRSLAYRLGRNPLGRGLAKGAAYSAAGLRHLLPPLPDTGGAERDHCQG